MHRLRVGQAGVLAVCVLASTACGSKPSVDKGGFTAAERTSAQTALDLLQQTPVPRAIVAISYQTGAAPSTCVVLPNPSAKGAFKLVVAWKPTRPDFMSVPQSVLEATMSDAASKKDAFHISSFGGGGHNPKPEPANIEADVVRANLANPAEPCEVLESGHLRLAVPH
jgi:hypothetical protein